MGTLAYGHLEHLSTIDDRSLRHLQVVIIAKLRQGERFSFSFVDSDSGAPVTLWMTPDIPIRFELAVPPTTELNREWIAVLRRAAQEAEGLHVVDEPPVLRALPSGRSVRELAAVRA